MPWSPTISSDDVVAIHSVLVPTVNVGGEIVLFGGDNHDRAANEMGQWEHTRRFNCRQPTQPLIYVHSPDVDPMRCHGELNRSRTSGPENSSLGRGFRHVSTVLSIACAAVPGLSAATDAIVPRLARADTVIANSGCIVSSEHSLVDSYNSTLGPYGCANIGNNEDVCASSVVIKHGVIKGSLNEHPPAGLPDVPISLRTGARWEN